MFSAASSSREGRVCVMRVPWGHRPDDTVILKGLRETPICWWHRSTSAAVEACLPVT